MSLSIFGEKASVPTEEMLSEALSDNRTIWDNVLGLMDRTFGNMNTEWKYYSKSAGWTFVVSSKKRKITYLVPLEGYFKANFVFGEKAVEEARHTDLPGSILTLIVEATPYMEGRSFMIDIKNDVDVGYFEKLLKIKNET